MSCNLPLIYLKFSASPINPINVIFHNWFLNGIAGVNVVYDSSINTYNNNWSVEQRYVPSNTLASSYVASGYTGLMV
jgi:hypothetical protein